jgi:hypothetical protein
MGITKFAICILQFAIGFNLKKGVELPWEEQIDRSV